MTLSRSGMSLPLSVLLLISLLRLSLFLSGRDAPPRAARRRAALSSAPTRRMNIKCCHSLVWLVKPFFFFFFLLLSQLSSHLCAKSWNPVLPVHSEQRKHCVAHSLPRRQARNRADKALRWCCDPACTLQSPSVWESIGRCEVRYKLARSCHSPAVTSSSLDGGRDWKATLWAEGRCEGEK